MIKPSDTADACVRRPADWEPVQTVWLAWPHRPTTWPGRLPQIQRFYEHWITRIAESTPVQLLVGAEDGQGVDPKAESLTSMAGVTLHHVATDDAWIRDYGPQWVWRDDRLAIVDFRFNSWGGKYPPWERDDSATKKIAEIVDCDYRRVDLVLEGGGIEFGGDGRVLISQGSVIDPDRNPGVAPEAVAEILWQHLGVTEIGWMRGEGLDGDDTDGHIDQVARFVAPNRVVVATGHPDSPPDQRRLRHLRTQLQLWAANSSPKVEIIDLPPPSPRQIDGQTVPQSYANFLRLGPDRILVPTFGDAADDHAIAILRDASGADCEPIDCREMVYGLGALHCASCEQPASPIGDSTPTPKAESV